MKTELITKTLVAFIGTLIMLASVRALAFIPPQPAVDVCVDAVEQKYNIVERDLGLETVRARPVGDKSAVIYLSTTVDTAQPSSRLYCTVDEDGDVTRLHSNPRQIDTVK